MVTKGNELSSSFRSNIFIDSSAIFIKEMVSFSRDKKLILAFMISSFYVLVSLVLGMINVLLETGFTPYISQIYSGFIFASLIMVMTMVFQVYLTEYLNENALLRTEMQKSEKLNIVSELAASVAHEVRNPLTVVRGFIQLLESTEDVKNKDYMRLVLAELDRAEQIISDYLNLARPQIEKKNTFVYQPINRNDHSCRHLQRCKVYIYKLKFQKVFIRLVIRQN